MLSPDLPLQAHEAKLERAAKSTLRWWVKHQTLEEIKGDPEVPACIQAELERLWREAAAARAAAMAQLG